MLCGGGRAQDRRGPPEGPADRSPIREAGAARKEMIAGFSPRNGIIQCSHLPFPPVPVRLENFGGKFFPGGR